MEEQLDQEEIARWVSFYLNHYTEAGRRADLANLENGLCWFPPSDTWEKPYRIAALRQLLTESH